MIWSILLSLFDDFVTNVFWLNASLITFLLKPIVIVLKFLSISVCSGQQHSIWQHLFSSTSVNVLSTQNILFIGIDCVVNEYELPAADELDNIKYKSINAQIIKITPIAAEPEMIVI